MFDIEFRIWWLLLLTLPSVPLVYRLFRRPMSLVQYSSLEIIEHVPKSLRGRLLWLPAALMALGTAVLIAAAAGPRTPDDQTRIRRQGIAIMMVVDRSSSMNARDLVADDRNIDRLTVVKDVFEKFVLGTGDAGKGRTDDMIGLVTFAGYADSICPLTYDHFNLVSLVRQTELADTQHEDGTAMGDGLALAVERLRQSPAKSRVCLLLTDGVNNAGVIDPLQAARLAAENNIRVYCIGTGTRGLAPYPVQDPFSGRIVLRPAEVDIDEDTLREIAKLTTGEYFRATEAETLSKIYQRIDELERTEVSQDRFLRYAEHYGILLTSGSVLVALAWILDRSVFRHVP
jgi:Ca-activated chloride channel family protein